MEVAIYPLVTVASIAIIAVAFRIARGTAVSKGVISAVAGFVLVSGISALTSWAEADTFRLSIFLAVMVGVALFAGFEIVRKAVRRRPAD